MYAPRYWKYYVEDHSLAYKRYTLNDFQDCIFYRLHGGYISDKIKSHRELVVAVL